MLPDYQQEDAMPLPLMINDLINSSINPEISGRSRLIQTHISFIILTDSYVYKIKKPVNLGFLDFSTLEKRHFYCIQELELNRRLSPDIYIGLLEIRKKDGHFFYDGKGELVDYAIKMKRIPEDLMMLNFLKDGALDLDILGRVARTIADFHKGAQTSDAIAAYGGPEMIKKNIEENFIQTEKYIDKTVSYKNYSAIKEYALNFIKQNETLFKKRMNENKIRDCHGDIHMEHVCIADKIYIYDCIEFNDRFRYGDVASDIAFLAMDLDFHEEKNLSDSFVDSYIKASGDGEIMLLIDFYKCYRACVRAKVDSFELDDLSLGEKEKEEAERIARRYFDLAFYYADR
jgi:aminoglycoside phosphotransferase family enzyme